MKKHEIIHNELFKYLSNLGFTKEVRVDRDWYIYKGEDNEFIALPKKLNAQHYLSVRKSLEEWGYLSDEDLIEFEDLFLK